MSWRTLLPVALIWCCGGIIMLAIGAVVINAQFASGPRAPVAISATPDRLNAIQPTTSPRSNFSLPGLLGELPAPGTIKFAGHKWSIKAPLIKAEPGPNLWSSNPENIFVDSEGRLHLRITQRNQTWYSAEIFSAESFGYGIYRFYVDTDLSAFDPNIAMGIFTYSEDPAFHHREVDIEFSTWTDRRKVNNAQYAVQPWTTPNNVHSFTLAPGATLATHLINWQPSKLSFQSLKGHAALPGDSNPLLHQWSYPGTIPPAGGEKLHINLWLAEGRVPTNGQEVEVIIGNLEFEPFAK